jgi:hypothetical protein
MFGPNLHTTVSLKNHVGDLCGGTVDWLTSSELQVSVDGHLELDSNCEVRVELRGLPVSIYIHGTIMKLEIDALGEAQTSALIRIDQMPELDRTRLEKWLSEGVTGGTSADPGSWVGELSEHHSGVHRSTGRSSIRSGLRAGLGLEPSKEEPSKEEPGNNNPGGSNDS